MFKISFASLQFVYCQITLYTYGQNASVNVTPKE